MDSGQQSPVADGTESVSSKTGPRKKFLNGWTKELEELMADWADKAACYRWMHEKTCLLFGGRDRLFNIPVIILSGLTAGANFALNSIAGDDKELQKWAQLGLGGASLITGIIQTFMNFYAYAKGSEAHRVAGISWGKFSRLLCIEMNLHPDERMDALNFLKMFRVELDRLIEQSPPIPENIIDQFNLLFKNSNVIKPEITGILEHTRVYKDQGSRLKKLAAEATIALTYKKGILKQLVIDDIEGKTRKIAIEAAKQVAKEIVDGHKSTILNSQNSVKFPRKGSFTETQKEERKAELIDAVKQKTHTVSELAQRFKKITPQKSGILKSNQNSPVIKSNKEVIYSDFTIGSNHLTIDNGIIVTDIQRTPVATENIVINIPGEINNSNNKEKSDNIISTEQSKIDSNDHIEV
jgi:hypothetical protein